MLIHCLIDLHASSLKIIGSFFPSVVTPTQTMTEDGFGLLKTILSSRGMLSFFLTKIRSFWQLW
ncbi:Hypothetical protein FKW44_001840, partial [Caligus rogercresseyi]